MKPSYLGRCWLLTVHVYHFYAVRGAKSETHMLSKIRWRCGPWLLLHPLEVGVQLHTIHPDLTGRGKLDRARQDVLPKARIRVIG